MSTDDGRRSDPKPLSLVEVVAAFMTFRRLFVVWGMAPLLVAVAPLIAGLCLSLFDIVSSGSGFLSLALTGAITLVGRNVIAMYAPSVKQRDDALSDSRVALPLVSFFCSRTIISYVLAPFAKFVGYEHLLKFSPRLPYLTAFCLSGCMLLLGAAVLCRFVGPISVVRCSSVPLRSDPMSFSLKLFWERCTSLEAFLGLVAYPSDNPGELIRTSFPGWRETGYRFHSPTIRAAIGLLLISAFAGSLLVLFLPIDHQTYSDPFVRGVLVVTCSLAVSANVTFTALGGTTHELDPKLYQSTMPRHIGSFAVKLASFVVKKVHSSTFLLTNILVPAVAIFLLSLATSDDATCADSMGSGSLFILALVVTSLISLYLVSIDEVARVVVCVPGMRPERLLEELSDDSPRETTLVVMCESILHGSDKIVRSVFRPTQRPGVLYAEDEELKHGEESMQRMGELLLGITDRHPQSSEGCLERDVLLVSILESLGGTTIDTGESSNPQVGNVSLRHIQAIERWANPKVAIWADAARREPDAVPLLRALCAYAGGLGDALQTCTLPPNDAKRLALNETTPLAAWSLPPGARACSEWAIRAAARLIVYSFTSTEGSVTEWRRSPLSICVPTMLHAAFTLRKGVLRFARIGHGRRVVVSNAIDIDWITGENEFLRPVVRACDESAQLVVRALETNGANRASIRMLPECRQWVEAL